MKLSVIMSVFNGQKYLHQAIESVLYQTFPNFEFIIIDDGSTDQTVELITKFADNRILLIENPCKRGLTINLNTAASISRGQYIARMDADDICYQNRFKTQLDFLEANQDISVVGSFVKMFGQQSQVAEYPLHNEAIQAQLLTSNAFAHPSIMMRKDKMISDGKIYNEKFEKAQDYELWNRMIEKVKMANIPKVLLKYRTHYDQISKAASKEQQFFADKARKILLNRYFPELTDNEMDIFNLGAKYSAAKNDTDTLIKLDAIFIKIIEKNNLANYFNRRNLINVLGATFATNCYIALRSQNSIGNYYWESRLRKHFEAPLSLRVKMRLAQHVFFREKNV